MQSRVGATAKELCPGCQAGYHAPFQRFERIAVISDGPAFLQRCRTCGALWQESLHDAGRVTSTEAAAIFPGVASRAPAVAPNISSKRTRVPRAA